mmetsp:Transcript_61539/g.71612  ORF Transcript_61539/g.71612 Transcript_61539/m.71612 type:complete len:202 (-) Transcript_61539:158-763(-)
MSEGHEEAIKRSLRVFDLPSHYEIDEITKIFENVGGIKEFKTGNNEVVLTFSDQNAKEMAKMYDGCSVLEKYTLKLEDATYLDPKVHHESKKNFSNLNDLPESKSEYVPASKLKKQEVKIEEEREKFVESETERLLESHSEHDRHYSEHSKEFLMKLHKTNLPARSPLKEDDPFLHYTKREFFLTFVAAWSLLWFVSSLLF